MRKQRKPKHWRTREQFVEAERKVRQEREALEVEKRDAAEVDEDLRQQRP